MCGFTFWSKSSTTNFHKIFSVVLPQMLGLGAWYVLLKSSVSNYCVVHTSVVNDETGNNTLT
jgi:hypothetical protein